MTPVPLHRLLFIDNQATPACTGETLPVIDPSDGTVFASVARGTAADIDRAVAAARTALSTTWGKTSAADRSRLLLRWAARVT
ncbi:MAG: aldehyde dehydrogenase family protein, partial [Burkholderiales bacterium]